VIEKSAQIYHIAIIGGTGKEGKGLGFRWGQAGHHIIIGSRNIEKAAAAAQALRELSQDSIIQGMTNPEAVKAADIMVITVPFSAHESILIELEDALQGKLLIDVTVPLVPPRVTRIQMPAAGSAALEARKILGPDARIVSAFQNISYEHLLDDRSIDCDVLVTGTDKESRQLVLGLVADAGMVGWDAGPIENSVIAEGLTSILIGINKALGTQSAGIRITGVPHQDGH
jgi:8-hydroxy-5-deazaflavin:NADPH oxidoreductase